LVLTEIAIILGSIAPEKVQEYYGDGSRFGVKIAYVNQGEPKGIAHAVSLTQNFVGHGPFVVFFADNILKGAIREMVEEFRVRSQTCVQAAES
jgi:glucose-1-phosphate thymidylyltransferase